MATPAALADLAVVELGGVAASYAGKLLADFGADVVKLEEPAAARLDRSAAPVVDDGDGAGAGALFRYLNTNKRSRVLGGDPAELGDLLAAAAVLVTDRPPAALAEAGLGLADLRRRHPHLVVATITPWGTTGPYADLPGGELVTYAMGGLAHASPGLPDLVDDPDREPPLHPGGHPAGIAAGVVAAIAALAAVPLDRDRAAEGRHLDVSQQAAVASLIYRNLAVTAYGGGDVGRRYPGPLNMPNYYLPCRDSHVAIAAPQQPQWERLVAALGSPAWAQQERFATPAGRNRNREALHALLQEWCEDRSGDEVVAAAQAHGVPCFRFYSLEQMEGSDHVRERGSLVDVPGAGASARMPGPPVRLSRTPWALRRGAPGLGEDPGPPAVPPPTPAQPGNAPGPLPLSGIRILDFGQVLALPFATQWLAWLGAEVILVESTRHLHTRVTPPYADDRTDPDLSGVFNTFNSSKKSITVNLKDPRGRDLVTRLVPHCDVVMENFRAGVMERLGLAYDDLRRLRGDVIMLSLGAFGRTGPLRDGAGLHSAANLFSGLADVTRYPGGAPRIMGACLPDPLSGLYATLAVLMALRHRARTGEGQHVDQAMYEALLPFCAGAVMADPDQRAAMQRGAGPPSARLHDGVYRTRGDDSWIVLEIDDDRQWHAAERLAGLTDGGDPPRPADAGSAAARARLHRGLATWAAGCDLAEAVQRLRAAAIPAGPAQTSSQVLDDPQLRSIGFVRMADHREAGVLAVPTLPWRVEGWAGPDVRPPPTLGEHVDEVLTGLLGVSQGDVAALREEGVLR